MIASACGFARRRADYCDAPASAKITDATEERSAYLVIFAEVISFLQNARMAETTAINVCRFKFHGCQSAIAANLDKVKMTVF
ncbi:hypothetical protein [Rhizobium sp. No.120]